MQEESIMKAHWPDMEQVNNSLLKETEYFTHVCSSFQTEMKKQKDGIQPMYGVIYVYPFDEWWQTFLKEHYGDTRVKVNVFKPLFDLKSKGFLSDLPPPPELMKLTADDCDHKGIFTLLFNEKEALLNNIHFLTEVLDLKELWIEEVTKESLAIPGKKCMPCQPYLHLPSSPHKQFVEVTVANPTTIPIYDGDTYSSVVARIRRIKHTLNQKNVLQPLCNLRIKKSAAEADYQGIDQKTCFSIENEVLAIGEDDAQRIPLLGTCMEYTYSNETEK